METNYKVKHRRILMPLKLMLLLVAMVLLGFTTYAQMSKAVEVANKQQLIRALNNPSWDYLSFDDSFNGPAYLKAAVNSGGNRAFDCIYWIQESDTCFTPNDTGWCANAARAGTLDPFSCNCCPPADTGYWYWNDDGSPLAPPPIIPPPPGGILKPDLYPTQYIRTETLPFSVSKPGVYTLRYIWDAPWNSYAQTEYAFFDQYHITNLVSDDTCALETVVELDVTSYYGDPNACISFKLVSECTGQEIDVPGDELDTLWYYDPVYPHAYTFDTLQSFEVPVTAPTYGTWWFYVTIGHCNDTLELNCGDVVDSIKIEFFAQPEAYAGEDAEICDDMCYSLMGSAGSWFWNTCYYSPAFFAYTWVQLSGPGSLVFDDPNAFNTGVCFDTCTEYGKYEIEFQVTNGECYDSDTITLKFYEQPVADAGDDASYCFVDDCFNLAARPYTYCSAGLGEGERWRKWTKISGPADVTFSDETDPNAEVCPDTNDACIYGIYVFEWKEVNGTCRDSDYVAVTLYETPIADAGDDAWYCVDREWSMDLWHTFNAAPYTYCQDTGFVKPFHKWSKCGGPGHVTFYEDSTANAWVHVSAFGCYCFEWIEVNGDCEDRDTIEVCFYEHPYLEGEDLVDSLCVDSSLCYDLTGMVIPYEYLPPPHVNYDVQAWYQLSGSGNATFNPPDSADTEVCVDAYGCYSLAFIQYNGDTLCADTLNVDLWFFEQPVADAGEDAAVCGPCYMMSAVPYSYVVNECHPADDQMAFWSFVGYIPPDSVCDLYVQYYPCYTITDIYDPHAEICICQDDYYGTQYGTYIFQWIEINGTCMDADTVEITLQKVPDELPVIICGEESNVCNGYNNFASRDNCCPCDSCLYPTDTVISVCAYSCKMVEIDWECFGNGPIPGYTYEWSFIGPAGSYFEADPYWYDCTCDEWKGKDWVHICFGECCDTARLYLTITTPEGCTTTEEWKFYVEHLPIATISGPEIAEVSSIFEYSIPDPANPCYLYIWEVVHCGEIVYGQGTGTVGVHWTDYNANGGWGLVTVEVHDTCTGCCNVDDLAVRVLPQYSLGNGTLEGYVKYNSPFMTPLNGVKLTLWNGGVPIFETYSFNDIEGGNGVGYYAFEGINETTVFGLTAEYSAPWYGANATDALAVELQVIAPTWTDPVRIEAGDVNGSGAMSATDALWIKQRAIAMVNHFPAGDWAFADMSSTATTYNVWTLNYGDVNATWNIPNSMKDMPAVTIVNDGVINVVPGEEFDLPLRVAESVSLGAITLNLGYNSNLLEVVEVSAVEGALSNVTSTNIVLAWSNVNPMILNNNDGIVTLRLKALGQITSNDLMFTVEIGTEFADPNANVLEDLTLKTFGISTEPAATDYFLSYNRPNPFSTSTQIEYTMPESGKVRLSVVDLLGQEIAVLVNQTQSAGSYTVQYDAAGMAPGVYIYKITVEGESRDFVETRRMVISQ